MQQLYICATLHEQVGGWEKIRYVRQTWGEQVAGVDEEEVVPVLEARQLASFGQVRMYLEGGWSGLCGEDTCVAT